MNVWAGLLWVVSRGAKTQDGGTPDPVLGQPGEELAQMGTTWREQVEKWEELQLRLGPGRRHPHPRPSTVWECTRAGP